MIEWRDIFPSYVNESLAARGGKFELLPRPLPWVGTREDTLSLTLEWLLRDNRTDDIRLCGEPIVNLIRNRWYRAEFENGRFIHLCYPKEFVDFRRMYESAWQLICLVAEQANATQITMYHEVTVRARGFLWSLWNCMGGDGMRRQPPKSKVSKDPDPFFTDLAHTNLGYSDWPQIWTNKCSRCGEPLPRALQLWTALQHSNLKDAN